LVSSTSVLESTPIYLEPAKQPSRLAKPDDWEWRLDERKQPHRDNGEEEIAQLLRILKVKWYYEPIFYPLEYYDSGNIAMGFMPDFYLVKTSKRPGFHIEVTTSSGKEYRAHARKAELTRQIYSVKTVLIHYPLPVEYKRSLPWFLNLCRSVYGRI